MAVGKSGGGKRRGKKRSRKAGWREGVLGDYNPLHSVRGHDLRGKETLRRFRRSIPGSE